MAAYVVRGVMFHFSTPFLQPFGTSRPLSTNLGLAQTTYPWWNGTEVPDMQFSKKAIMVNMRSPTLKDPTQVGSNHMLSCRNLLSFEVVLVCTSLIKCAANLLLVCIYRCLQVWECICLARALISTFNEFNATSGRQKCPRSAFNAFRAFILARYQHAIHCETWNVQYLSDLQKWQRFDMIRYLDGAKESNLRMIFRGFSAFLALRLAPNAENKKKTTHRRSKGHPVGYRQAHTRAVTTTSRVMTWEEHQTRALKTSSKKCKHVFQM